MSYSIGQVQQGADLTLLKNEALKEKRRLLARKTNVEIQVGNLLENKDEISGGLTAINTEVNTVTTVVAGLADGPTKEDFTVKLRKLEFRQFLLQNRAKTKGLVPVIQYEHDIKVVDAIVIVIDDFIVRLDAGLAALPA